jgi:hypothetical protein
MTTLQKPMLGMVDLRAAGAAYRLEGQFPRHLAMAAAASSSSKSYKELAT